MRDEGIVTIQLQINTGRYTKPVRVFSQNRVSREEADAVIRQFKIDNPGLDNMLISFWQAYPEWL